MNPTDTDITIHRDVIAKRETTPSCVWKNPKTGEIVVSMTFVRERFIAYLKHLVHNVCDSDVGTVLS